jgi:hypothetical protein
VEWRWCRVRASDLDALQWLCRLAEFKRRGVPPALVAAEVEEGFRLQRHQRTSQRGGRNPARVIVTSRWTAALDGRLLAAVRAWRQ